MTTKRFGHLGCRLTALLLVAASAATTARAQQTSEVAPAPAALALSGSAANVVPEGTPVFVALKQTLRSGQVRAGEMVAFEVVSDVRAAAAGGQIVLVPKGAPAWGKIIESRGAGAFGRPGRLRLSCDYLLLGDGTRLPLRLAASTLSARGRSRKGAAVVSGTLVGVGVGYVVLVGEAISSIGSGDTTSSPAPLLLGIGSGVLVSSLWRGGNVTLPEGKTFAVEVAAVSASDPPPASNASP